MTCSKCKKSTFGKDTLSIFLEVKACNGDTFSKKVIYCKGCFEERREEILSII